MSHLDLNSHRSRHECITDALDQALSLKKERESRPTKLHAEDTRIPREIVDTLYRLGHIQRSGFARIDRLHEEVLAAFQEIAEAKSAHALLTTELNIATYQETP